MISGLSFSTSSDRGNCRSSQAPCAMVVERCVDDPHVVGRDLDVVLQDRDDTVAAQPPEKIAEFQDYVLPRSGRFPFFPPRPAQVVCRDRSEHASHRPRPQRPLWRRAAPRERGHASSGNPTSAARPCLSNSVPSQPLWSPAPPAPPTRASRPRIELARCGTFPCRRYAPGPAPSCFALPSRCAALDNTGRPSPFRPADAFPAGRRERRRGFPRRAVHLCALVCQGGGDRGCLYSVGEAGLQSGTVRANSLATVH